MKRALILLLTVSSLVFASCSKETSQSEPFEYIDTEPVNNLEVKLPEDYLVDNNRLSLTFYSDGEVGYKEYYSSLYKETIRLYDEGTFIYTSSRGGFLSYYHTKGDLLVVQKREDQFLFMMENNTLKEIEEYSWSESGFDLNNRTFNLKKTVNDTKYSFEKEEWPGFSIDVSINYVMSQEEFLELIDLEEYNTYAAHFYEFKNSSKTYMIYEFDDSFDLLDVVSDFFNLKKAINNLAVTFYFRTLTKRQIINPSYYSLSDNYLLKDYKYAAVVNSFYFDELMDEKENNHLFTSKEELFNFFSPIMDIPLGNFQQIKEFLNDFDESIFNKYNVFVSKEIVTGYASSKYEVSKIYSVNKTYILFDLYNPHAAGWAVAGQRSYIIYLPKSITLDSVELVF